MKELKNAVLTLRTTDDVKAKLEEEADDRGWSVSQLAEYVLSRFVSNESIQRRNDVECSDSKRIFDYLMSNDCKELAPVVSWVISEGLLDSFQLGLPIWTALIEENRNR